MAKLQRAGIVNQIWSFLFPKELEVQVRTEVLPDGSVELTPVYSVGGQEVDPDLVKPDRRQRILGYAVEANDTACKVSQQGRRRLTKRKAAECLEELKKGKIRVQTPGQAGPMSVREVKPDVTLTLDSSDGLHVRSTLATPQGEVVERPVDLDQLRQDEGWYIAGRDLVHVPTTNTNLDAALITGSVPTDLTGDSVPDFLKNVDAFTSSLGHVEKSDNLRDLGIYGEKTQNRVKVDGDAQAIQVQPSLVWLGKNDSEHELAQEDLQAAKSGRRRYGRIPEGWVEIDPRKLAGYQEACQDLNAQIGGLEPIEGPRIPETLLKLLRQEGFASPWTVYFSQAVKDAHRIVDTPAKVEFRLNVVDRDGRSLLELDPIYNHERFQLSHEDSVQGVADDEGWVRRRDAWVKIDKEKSRRIATAIDELGLQPGQNGFSFPASQRERVIEVFSLLGSFEHTQAYADFLVKLADFEKIEDVPLPATLRPEIALRTYQKHGYNWLAFLHRFGLNGVLADDMGLGKTLQTLAVIQRAKEHGHGRLPSLILCPTSVVRNWEAEAKKFFRECPVVVYTGDRREAKLRLVLDLLKFAKQGLAVPLVVTSYDIARRDYEELNRIPWLYVIVDEGHNIKNPDAQRTKAIKTINGQHKLALTGTPIQNNLEELWSLFDFIMPGYLGSRGKFRDLYGRNGRVNWDAVRQGNHRLRDRIHPFILRRLKENVAKDLPQKILVDRLVGLTPIQIALYKELLKSADYQKLVDEVEAKGVNRSKTLILAIYTRLRALCNHPCLINHRLPPRYQDSGKLDCLKELMEEILESEHRALLFCQSTRMLDIIQEFFGKWKVELMRLDGTTPPAQRQSLVDEFNQNEAKKCFLISTKAGGTGLNLTGADTVIFYDHDWNPANDAQAQDRAYRIGQTRPVTVYKLISKGTIEEKIIERQAIKKMLADEIISPDEQGFKELTKDELLALFRLDEEE